MFSFAFWVKMAFGCRKVPPDASVAGATLCSGRGTRVAGSRPPRADSGILPYSPDCLPEVLEEVKPVPEIAVSYEPCRHHCNPEEKYGVALEAARRIEYVAG